MPNRAVKNNLGRYLYFYSYSKTIHSRHELLQPPASFTPINWNSQHIIFVNDEFNTNVLEYGTDIHRRLIQINPSWGLCPISNSRMYLKNNNTHENKELLFAKSVYFDVPIQGMVIVSNPNNSKSFLLFQVISIALSLLSNNYVEKQLAHLVTNVWYLF